MSTVLVCADRGDDRGVARYIAAAERRGVRHVVVTASTALPSIAGAAGVVAVARSAASLAAEVAGRASAPWHEAVAVRRAGHRLALLGRLTAAGIPVPKFAAIDAASGDGLERLVTLPTPWRVSMPGRTGQVDGPDALQMLASRWLAEAHPPPRPGESLSLVVEPVMDGPTWLLVGLLDAGALRVVGMVQCDDLSTPTGPGTWVTSPVPLARDVQGHLAGMVSRACAALGLRQGPIVATCRRADGHACLHDLEPGPLEAPRSDVLALVDPALEQVSLEDVIVAHALGASLDGYGLAAEERRLLD